VAGESGQQKDDKGRGGNRGSQLEAVAATTATEEAVAEAGAAQQEQRCHGGSGSGRLGGRSNGGNSSGGGDRGSVGNKGSGGIRGSGCDDGVQRRQWQRRGLHSSSSDVMAVVAAADVAAEAVAATAVAAQRRQHQWRW